MVHQILMISNLILMRMLKIVLAIENDYKTGVEVLHLSNPGDYPEEYDELSFEVIEIDD